MPNRTLNVVNLIAEALQVDPNFLKGVSPLDFNDSFIELVGVDVLDI